VERNVLKWAAADGLDVEFYMNVSADDILTWFLGHLNTHATI
jgi:hypothetical protein